jgi:hypothetical protein
LFWHWGSSQKPWEVELELALFFAFQFHFRTMWHITLVQICSTKWLWVAIATLEQKAKGRASKLWGIRNNYASIWLHQRAFRYSSGLIYGEHFSWFWCIQISGQGVTIMHLDCTKAFDKICHIMTFFVPSIIHNGD